MNIFDTSFIDSVKAEISKQLSASDSPVTRNTVLNALNLGLDADGLKDAELAVSLAFRLGLVPEYKMFQKIGIKPADYVPGSKKKKEAEPKQRKLNPKVQAKKDAEAAAAAAASEDSADEAETSEEETSEE